MLLGLEALGCVNVPEKPAIHSLGYAMEHIAWHVGLRVFDGSTWNHVQAFHAPNTSDGPPQSIRKSQGYRSQALAIYRTEYMIRQVPHSCRADKTAVWWWQRMEIALGIPVEVTFYCEDHVH